MSKPLKFHQTLNLPPRSPARGKHRRADPSSHRRSVIGTDHSAGGSDEDNGTVWVTFTSGRSVTWSAVGNPDSWKPEPPTLPYAGIRTGELIGHRLWWVMPGNELCSLAHRRLWLPGETLSGDTNEWLQSDPVFLGVWGGIYSFFSADQMEHEIRDMADNLQYYARLRAGHEWIAWRVIGFNGAKEALGFVSGTVKMWGDVVEHETGWRAQFAKLHSIDKAYGGADLDAVRSKYFPS